MATDSREVLTLLAGKWSEGTRPKDLFVQRVARAPERHLAALLEGLTTGAPRVQNGCAELLSLIAEARPELLLPHFAALTANLDAKSPVLRWEAVCQLGWMARQAPDAAARLVPKLIPLLAHESVVLQGHAVRALARIGLAKPSRAPAILEALFAAIRHFPDNGAGFLVEAAGMLLAVPGLAAQVEARVRPLAKSPVAVGRAQGGEGAAPGGACDRDPPSPSVPPAGLRRALHPMPAFVSQALKERQLEQAYRARPAFQQNDYVGWISRAKREETQQKRLAQMLDELERGGVYMKMKRHARG